MCISTQIIINNTPINPRLYPCVCVRMQDQVYSRMLDKTFQMFDWRRTIY